MPFDSLPTDYAELRAFRDKLREPSQWPEGFGWNFAHCRHCAMGLLGVVPEKGPLWNTGFEPFLDAARVLEIPYDWSDWLFSSQPAIRRGIRAGDVTPEMVADDIDRLLDAGSLKAL